MDNEKKYLYDETTEAKADIVLKAIGKKLLADELKEFENIEKESADFVLPKSAEDKLQLMLNDYKSRQRIEKRKASVKRLGKVCAMLCVVLFISGVFVVNNAEAFKYRFQSFWADEHTEYIGLNASENPPEQQAVEEEIIIENMWFPDYVPEGFAVVKKSIRNNVVVVLFKDTQEMKVTFTQYFADGTSLNLNNEGTSQEYIKIQDKYDGYFSVVENNISLIWLQSDMIMELHGNVPLDELVQIAESVTFHK